MRVFVGSWPRRIASVIATATAMVLMLAVGAQVTSSRNDAPFERLSAQLQAGGILHQRLDIYERLGPARPYVEASLSQVGVTPERYSIDNWYRVSDGGRITEQVGVLTSSDGTVLQVHVASGDSRIIRHTLSGTETVAPFSPGTEEIANLLFSRSQSLLGGAINDGRITELASDIPGTRLFSSTEITTDPNGTPPAELSSLSWEKPYLGDLDVVAIEAKVLVSENELQVTNEERWAQLSGGAVVLISSMNLDLTELLPDSEWPAIVSAAKGE